MKKTWIDLLCELPVDVTLREFLTGHGLQMPVDFAWTDKPETTQALIAALLGCSDKPDYEGPLHAYRTLVRSTRRPGEYWMPCAAAAG